MSRTIYGNNLYACGAIKRKKKKKNKELRKEIAANRLPNGEVKWFPRMPGELFYQTEEWRKLRWQVLMGSDGKCSMCGRSKKDGAIMQVDHIIPRSRCPSLELCEKNLQVLCRDCNLGKGATTFKC